MSAGLHDTSQAVHQRFHWPGTPGGRRRGLPWIDRGAVTVACGLVGPLAVAGVLASFRADIPATGRVTMTRQSWDADRDGLPFSVDTELLAEADGLLMGRFLMSPLPGAHPTLEQRLVAIALADQAGAALANARRAR